MMKASALLFVLSLALGAVPAAFLEIRGWNEEEKHDDDRELQQQGMCCTPGLADEWRAYGDCSKYYRCVNGAIVGGLQSCARGTLFDGRGCNHAWAVMCKPATCVTTRKPTPSPTVPKPTPSPTIPKPKPTLSPTKQRTPTYVPTLAPQPPVRPGAKKFILRFDDAQDDYESDVQQAFFQWCMDNNVPISLGVIGGFFGADTALVNKIKECLGRGAARCEVFNHGWDAQTMLGTGGLSVTEIQKILTNVDNVIRSKLGRYQPFTMVPHTNDWGPNLLQALRNLGYETISASMDNDMKFDVTTTPLQMPQQTELAYYTEAGTWVGQDVQTIIKQCENTYLAGDEACVIMAHPHEFAGGQFTLDKLKDLTNGLKDSGWTGHTFGSVAAPYIPSRPTMSPTISKEPTAIGIRQYVLRLDDIQDYYLSSTQQSIIQWCMDNKMVVSLGVIGGFFGTGDVAIVNKVKACLVLGPKRCEVFHHGNDATNVFSEANGMSVQKIQALLQYAHGNITKTIGYSPKTMVPHQNSWGPNLIQALRNMYYNTISAAASGSEPMEFDMSQDPVRMPQQTETAVFENGGWSGKKVETIFADCEAAFKNGDAACVIMSHPQEFSEGKFTLTDLANLKALLKKNGWVSTTFNAVAKSYVPDHPTASPTKAPSLQLTPVGGNPKIAEWGQCGTTPEQTAPANYNCERGTYCKFGSNYWQSCQKCTVAPVTTLDCQQHTVKCPGQASLRTKC